MDSIPGGRLMGREWHFSGPRRGIIAYGYRPPTGQTSAEYGVMFGGYSQLPFNRLQTHDYQWANDSRALIYSANRGGAWNIWQAAADGSGEKQISTNEDKKLLFFNPAFSPDGTKIAWSAMTTGGPDQRSWAVWLHSQGETRPIYQSDSILRLVGWSAPGQQLIVKSGSGKSDTGLPDDFQIFELDTRDSSFRPLAALKAAFFQNVVLSHDAKTLAFVSRTSSGDAIQTLTLSRPGSVKTITTSNDNRVYFSNLTFAPDGKTLFFGKQSNSQVISLVENFK
jgi:Tol biopolymer transport system component